MDSTPNFRIKKMSPQLLVTNLDRSINFYPKKLRFDLDFFYEDFYAGIIKDGFSIHLKIGVPSNELNQNKGEKEHLDIIFAVEAIDNLYTAFLAQSIEIVQPLRDMPYGKEFYIADPDGYILAFLTAS